MLCEAPAADPIGALKPVEVARRADPPRTSGAFYNIWHTQAEFRRDLLQHVLSVERFEVGGPTVDTVADQVEQADFSLAETVRVAANLNFDGLKDDSSMRLKQALWSRHDCDPQISELIRGLYAGINTMLGPVYEAALTRAGRRMRPPYTIDHLATALAALEEGLHMRWTVQPESVPDDLGPGAGELGEGRWNLFSSVAYLIVTGMSEPAH